MEPDESRIEVDLDTANGPRVVVYGSWEPEDIEAQLPLGWTVGDNWHLGIKLLSGARAYPIVRDER